MSATLIIDDPLAGGSEAGAWATAIAHTPHLARQQETARVFLPLGARAGEAAGPPGRVDAASPIGPRATADTTARVQAGRLTGQRQPPRRFTLEGDA